MVLNISIYLTLGLLMLAAMAAMIVKISTLLGDCPQSGRAARAAGVTIASGYVTIGFGGVVTIGAILPLLEFEMVSLLLAIGLAAICLGLGFTHAIATMQAVVRLALQPQHPADSTPTAEASAA